MEYRKSVIIIMLAIFLFSIASVCASDVNDTAIASEDTTAIELSQSGEITTTDESQKTIQTNGTEMLTASDEETTVAQNNLDTLSLEEKTYADLSNAVGSGGNINLQPAYYKYNGESDTITITNPGSINGNGAIIDMVGSTIRAFTVNTEGVTINNLTIKNANINGNGGAIYFSNSGTVTNCNFTGNTAYYGGAVLFNSNGNVTNCNFTGNTATGDGGAIEFDGTGTVTNCNFTNNHATVDGGAVYFNNYGNVTNCNFTDNHAVDGGAIMFVSTGEVSNCNFTNNSASSRGGAVYFSSTGNVSNCNFTGNTATYAGGAVYFNGNGEVTNCNSADNKATGTNSWGGAIMFVSTGEVSNCNFTDNSANLGGAGYFNSNGEVTNCSFTDNKATGDGGAVCFTSNGDVLDCNFNSNSAKKGGAIYFTNAISNSNICAMFINNTADEGGAIFFNDALRNVKITGNYNHNTAQTSGGANFFINELKNVTITGNYTNNTALYNGGANHFNDKLTNVNITGNYTNNMASGTHFENGGGANYFNETLENVTIAGDYTSNTAFYFGGANNFNDKLTNVQITGNYTHNTVQKGYGGANYFDKALENVTITGNYTDNTAHRDGGANHFNDKLTNMQITGNYADNTAQIGGGGANDFRDTLTQVNITGNYNHNTAQTGGANDFQNTLTQVTITGNYTDNTAQHEGGANDFHQTLENVTIAGDYTRNTVQDNGGANHFDDKLTNVQITGNYINNTGPNAIYIYNSISDILIHDSVLINQKITIENGNIKVRDTWFGNNATNYNEMPDVGDNVNLENWLFLNATADPVSLSISDTSKIQFKLCSYNSTGTSDYDNSRLSPVNLTITATNGTADSTAGLGENITYAATGRGTGSVTASLENATCTITFNIKSNPELSVDAQDVYYSNNTIISLNYNSTATGKVNITLKGKKFDYTFENLALNASLSLGKVNPDEYNVTVIYSGDDTFFNASAKGNLTVTPIVDISITVTVDKDEYFVGDVVVWTLTVHNAGNGTNATDVYVDNNFPGDYFEMINATTYNGTYYKHIGNEYWWEIGFMANATDATLKIFSQAKAARNDIPNFANAFAKEDDWNYTNNLAQKDVTVNKANSTLNVTDTVLDYGQTANITVTAEGATGITASIITQKGNVIEAEVAGFTVMIPLLDAGNYTLNVTTKADANHNPATKQANITVNKAPTEITIASPTGEMSVGAMGHAAAELIPSEAGNLTYASNDTSVVNVSSTGVIKTNGAGTALITVSFAGSDNYAAAENKTIAITVKLNDASISVNNSTLELFIGDNFTVVAVSDPAGLNVTFVQDDSGVYIVDENGTVTALREGTGNVLVKVGDGKVYAVNSTEIAVSVSKVPTEININATSLDLFVGDETVIAANLTPDGAGNVTFTSGNETVVTVDADGNVIAQGKGQAIITVSFAGDNKYAEAQNKTVTVNVRLNDASVTVDNATLDLNIGETYAINATKHPDTIMLDITYTSSNSSVVRVDKKGVVTAVSEGAAVITVEVGDGEIYAINSTNVTVSVSKVPTEIDANSITATYNVDKNLVITLKDANGNPVSGENITVDLNGAKNYTTDENGSVIVSTKGLAPGIYAANITFNGTNVYVKSASEVNVTVKKATPKITAKAKTFKTTTKTKKYTITLKNNIGKPIRKVTVYLKVGGKTYKATTNSKGKATFKITKLNNKGTYKATVTYKGNKYYNKATKKVTIKVKSVWKTVSKGSKNSAIVKKIQRALKNNGYYLEYNGRYLMVDGIFWDYTEMAVKEFQNDKVLKVTGKVDEKTAKKLGII